MPQKSCVDLRGETKFRRKFFAKLSFKKAGGETLRHSLRADEDIGPYGRGGQKRNEVSQEVLCQAFFQESGGETLRHSLRADEDIGPYGRGGRGETKFRRKFFCLLFLQEK